MIKQLTERLKTFQRVGVFSHIRPDGDCIGSQVAMVLWLQKNGVEAYAFNDDHVPLNLKWLTEYVTIHETSLELMAQCDAFIVLDGNSPSRFGPDFEHFVDSYNPPRFMIDHHPEPTHPGFEMVISVDSASSTCELVYYLFEENDINQLDTLAAKALYTGLLTDTGSMQYDSVTPNTMQIASKLLEHGDFRPNEVAEKVFANKRKEQLQLLGLALRTIRLYQDNQIATMYVTSEMLEKTNTTNDDCEGFVAYPLSISGIKAAVLFKDMGNGIKMSLRSKSDLNVNTWARKLDGGGHKKASGAWHPGPLEAAIEEVVAIGAQQLLNMQDSQ